MSFPLRHALRLSVEFGATQIYAQKNAPALIAGRSAEEINVLPNAPEHLAAKTVLGIFAVKIVIRTFVESLVLAITVHKNV